LENFFFQIFFFPKNKNQKKRKKNKILQELFVLDSVVIVIGGAEYSIFVFVLKIKYLKKKKLYVEFSFRINQ